MVLYNTIKTKLFRVNRISPKSDKNVCPIRFDLGDFYCIKKNRVSKSNFNVFFCNANANMVVLMTEHVLNKRAHWGILLWFDNRACSVNWFTRVVDGRDVIILFQNIRAKLHVTNSTLFVTSFLARERTRKISATMDYPQKGYSEKLSFIFFAFLWNSTLTFRIKILHR